MIVKDKKTKKVVCAMSGGIDSSVAAALLKKQGYDVIGVFMKFWADNTKGAENRCCSAKAETRARKVASILKIPFYVFDFQKEFKKRIVEDFLKEYKAGRTPNPCVACNKQIKFGLLLERALKLNADFVATGHYARLRREIPNSKFQIPKIRLLKGKDLKKDQSYFLWQLNQKQLKRILFPIGDYTKPQVRKLAKKFKLPVLDIKESMEICFVPTSINNFLKKHLKIKPGPIISSSPGEEERVVGKHQGLWFYTIGQRRRLGIIAGGPAFAKASTGKPYFVLDKDIKRNALIVTKNEKDLYKKELVCKNVNWISGHAPLLVKSGGLKIKAKIRYHHSPAPATITYQSKNLRTYKLIFEKPQRAITSGQSVVFYVSAEASTKADKRNELFGGGIID